DRVMDRRAERACPRLDRGWRASDRERRLVDFAARDRGRAETQARRAGMGPRVRLAARALELPVAQKVPEPAAAPGPARKPGSRPEKPPTPSERRGNVHGTSDRVRP